MTVDTRVLFVPPRPGAPPLSGSLPLARSLAGLLCVELGQEAPPTFTDGACVFCRKSPFLPTRPPPERRSHRCYP